MSTNELVDEPHQARDTVGHGTVQRDIGHSAAFIDKSGAGA